MNNSIGLWQKTSQKGNTYASGKAKIGEKEYRIALFKNENKKTEKSPDYSLIIDEINNDTKKEEKGENEAKNGISDDVFKEFGEQIEINESDLAF